MLTHVLWFLALVVSCWGVAAAAAEARNHQIAAERARHDAEATMLREAAGILKVQRDAAVERGLLVLEHKNAMVDALREEITDLRSRLPRPRPEVDLDGDFEDPPTIGQADMMAMEAHRREQLRLDGEGDVAPPTRLDRDDDE